MIIEKLYFDMDGVLADFDRGVAGLCQMIPIAQNDARTEEDDRVMWQRISQVSHFNDRLEPMAGAKEMFDMAVSMFGDKVEILTGVPRPHRNIPDAAVDKVKWVHRVLSPDVIVHTVLRKDKPNYCTGASCVLVDDLKSNIDAWEQVGGTGILHADAKRTMEILQGLK